MAYTNYGVNDPLAVKVWSKALSIEALKQTWMYKFIGTDYNNILQLKDELTKSAGDRITCGLRMLLNGQGVSGDSTLEGNEERLVTYSDSLYINQLRNAVISQGRMSEQRVLFDVRQQAFLALKDWIADRLDTWAFNQLAGVAPTVNTDYIYTGMNATSNPTNIVYANSRTTEASVAAQTSATFKLSYLDMAVEKAQTASPSIRPIMVDGEAKYVCFLHPYQVFNLRAATSDGEWLDIQKAALAGGIGAKSPIYSGALGEYNGVVLHQSTRVPSAVTNVRRAVFCGAQAGNIAYGRMNSDNKILWDEEMFDLGNKIAVGSSLIGGLKKSVYNSVDYGVIVIETYAVAHA